MKNTKGKVVIYVKKGCPYCRDAKKLLDDKGVKYEEIDAGVNPDLFDKIKSKYSVKTVPQIFITDEDGNYICHIAGCDKLMNLEREGRLDDILNGNECHTTYTNNNDEYEEYIASHDDFI